LHKILDEKLKILDIKSEERKYTPHITLARIKKNNIAKFLGAYKKLCSLRKIEYKSKEITISQITIVHSKNGEYIPLSHINLSTIN